MAVQLKTIHFNSFGPSILVRFNDLRALLTFEVIDVIDILADNIYFTQVNLNDI